MLQGGGIRVEALLRAVTRAILIPSVRKRSSLGTEPAHLKKKKKPARFIETSSYLSSLQSQPGIDQSI